ncbi:hypothetical protein [Psychrobacillus sp.]|uniref:hypothetical protein n=1 Tax=Psychrobacillus sp. TaxID=1871623 RepID=UPI0028BF2846|nr:hypothetical protein [Psychrobacillus sp.]
MFENFDLVAFLVGLPLAIVIMGIVFFINRKIGKKKRLFDERYTKINEKARSISWVTTTIVILIVWMIIIFVEGPSLSFFLITAVWVIHMFSYLIGSIIASKSI